MITNAQIADDVPLPILVFVDAGGELEWLNLAGQFWLGSSLKSLSGKKLSDIFHDYLPMQDILAKSLERMTPVQVHNLVITPRGRDEEKCHVSSFVHEDKVGICIQPQGRQTSTANMFDDGTSALGRLLAHEIKNPLAGIRGAAQLLRDDIESEEGQSLIALIEQEIGRIRRLADKMERLGDMPSGDFAQINIHEILRHARKVIQSGISANIVFTEKYDPSLPLTLGDEDTLTQAILNLIKNAAEAMGPSVESPEIVLETSYRASGGLPVEIRIKDNGMGIPEHVRDKIFQPFITHKPKGQGLGLALVSKVVSAHNGLIEVTSRPGETVFSILLPVLKGKPS